MIKYYSRRDSRDWVAIIDFDKKEMSINDCFYVVNKNNLEYVNRCIDAGLWIEKLAPTPKRQNIG